MDLDLCWFPLPRDSGVAMKLAPCRRPLKLPEVLARGQWAAHMAVGSEPNAPGISLG